jgi:hypothetical protein
MGPAVAGAVVEIILSGFDVLDIAGHLCRQRAEATSSYPSGAGLTDLCRRRTIRLALHQPGSSTDDAAAFNLSIVGLFLLCSRR